MNNNALPELVLDEIHQFLSTAMSGSRFSSSKWFDNEHINLYIRYTRRFVNGELINTIDIASISVPLEWQGYGVFSGILSSIETTYPTVPIFVESILNNVFKQWLIRRGYVVVPNTDPPSVILLRTTF